jgi:hypothetical protein
LTKAIEKIMAEDNGKSLWKRITELKVENSYLKASAVESAETIDMLLNSVYSGIEDYDLLQEGNKSLLAECDEMRYHCEDLESALVRVCSSAVKDIAALESRIRSVMAYSMEVAATGKKRLSDFEGELIGDLAELCTLYECSIQSRRFVLADA